MKINEDLNLVIPVTREQESLSVYSSPISWDVFDLYHGPLGRAYDSLTKEGLNLVVCLATAKLALQDAAKDMGVWSGPDGVENGLLGELRRTSMVNYPTGKGWEVMTLDDASRRGVLDSDEVREVENALVFFTLIYRLFTKTRRATILRSMGVVGGFQLTSLGFTEYQNSLPTSTTGADTAT